MIATDQAAAQFRAAMQSRGLIPPAQLVTGRLARCDVTSRNGAGDGAYLLHLDGMPAGGYQNHQDGLGWQTWAATLDRPLTHGERRDAARRHEAARREREADEQARHAEARERAARIWREAEPAPADHPYLTRKGVLPHGLRVHDGALVVPIRDTSGALHSLEFIDDDGTKRFLAGGRKRGGYFAIGAPGDVLVIAEGFATAASIHEATGHAVACAFDAGNLEPVARALRAKLPGVRLILAADNDVQGGKQNVGILAARKAAGAVDARVAIPEHNGDNIDFNDLHVQAGAEAVRTAIDAAQPSVTDWPDPQPLPDGLPPVPAYDDELLPPVLAAWVRDIAERLQVPADFPAAALSVALGACIGRSRMIQVRGDWHEVPNLWGALIGPPGVMKSPAIRRALAPLEALERAAFEAHGATLREYEAHSMVREAQAKDTKDRIAKALKAGNRAEACDLALAAVGGNDDAPTCRRYLTNDSTVEKLGALLAENPRGLLVMRDELAGWFAGLERQGHEQDRAFYLEAWAGLNAFTYDRIGRGTLHIPAACLSLIGTIQPGPLAELIRRASGVGDDGLMQRFQVAVQPDIPADWQLVAREPDAEAAAGIAALFQRLAARCDVDDNRAPAVLRFDVEAQPLMDAWQTELEHRLRRTDDAPAIVAHLAKYRKLVPALALILHTAESEALAVSRLALERAIAWAEHLEAHARRIYAPIAGRAMDAARLVIRRIEAGALPATFALRDIYRTGWHGLTDRERVQEAVIVLTDFDWVRSRQVVTAGRTATVYELHPSLPRRAEAPA